LKQKAKADRDLHDPHDLNPHLPRARSVETVQRKKARHGAREKPHYQTKEEKTGGIACAHTGGLVSAGHASAYPLMASDDHWLGSILFP
jgi:hypothetical protein